MDEYIASVCAAVLDRSHLIGKRWGSFNKRHPETACRLHIEKQAGCVLAWMSRWRLDRNGSISILVAARLAIDAMSRCQAVTTMQKLGMQYIATVVVEAMIDQQGGANRSPKRAAI